MLRYILPDPELGKYIKNYFLLHFVFGKDIVVPIKPLPANPEQGMTFYIQGKLFSQTLGKRNLESRAKSVVFGQLTNRQNLQPTHEFKMFEVRFQPGAFFKLFKIPMTEFVDENMDAEIILGTEIKQLNEQFANTDKMEDLAPIFEKYIWRKIKGIKESISPIGKIGQIIFNNPQNFNYKNLAQEACLSISQFERLFLKQIGIPAKFYAKICRFHNAYKMKEQKPNLNWFEIAIDTGYSDYQHLAKDFKQFSGGTPTSLITEAAQAPEKILGFADFVPLRLK